MKNAIPAFKLNRPSTGNFKTIDRSEFVANSGIQIKRMRPTQKMVYDAICNAMYAIVSQSPGAGKSTLAEQIFLEWLLKDKNRKLIIICPQTLCFAPYVKCQLVYPNGRELSWDIGNNLLSESLSASKIKDVIAFLKRKKFSHDPAERIMLCSHSALGQAFQRCKKTKGLFANTALVEDEAHKLMYASNGEREVANRLGEVTSYILKSGDPTTRLWLMTATFFRGDRCPIIPEEYMDRFKVHSLPFSEHWKHNCPDLESIETHFVPYNDCPFRDVKDAIKEKVPTIIYCPSNDEWLAKQHGGKYGFVAEVSKHIRIAWPKANILDLVTEAGRDTKKRTLIRSQGEEYDVILSIDLLNESVDWPKAAKIIDLSPSNSSTLLTQRHGRLHRHYPNKSVIQYLFFVHKPKPSKDKEKERQDYGDVIRYLVMALEVKERLEPVSSLAFPKKNNRKPVLATNWLAESVPNEAKRDAVIEQAYLAAIRLGSQAEESGSPVKSEHIFEAFKQILVEFDIKKNIEETALYIGAMFQSYWQNANGGSVVGMKFPSSSLKNAVKSIRKLFDDIKWNVIFNGINACSSKLTGFGSLQELRLKVATERKSPYEHVCKAEQLAKEHGGKLPCQQWLRKNGYGALLRCMQVNPSLFDHIIRDFFRGKTIEERIVEAEQLAAKNGGVLPNKGWLQKNGYSGLMAIMDKYRNYFKHIRQEIKARNAEYRINEAKIIASKNNGVLPSYSELRKTGHKSLARYMNEHPDFFQHLPQEKARFDHDESKAQITKLCKTNGGRLPSYSWMVANGYGKLFLFYRRHMKTDMNNNVKVDRKVSGLNERLQEAKQLCKEHGGVLPSYTWMQNNGRKALCSMIRKNCNAFSDFNQQFVNSRTGEISVRKIA